MTLRIILPGTLAFLILSGSLGAREGAKVTTETLLKSTRSWDGETLPPYPDGQPEITLLKIVIPPGVRLPMHKHPYINAGILLKGELTVTTEDGQVVTLKGGDALVEVVGKLHFGANTGNEAAEILVFYAGIRGEPITIKED